MRWMMPLVCSIALLCVCESLAQEVERPIAPAEAREFTLMPPRQVQVDLQIAEISLTRMRSLGIEFTELVQFHPSAKPVPMHLVDPNRGTIDFEVFNHAGAKSFKMFFDALEKEGVYNVVCTQSIVATNGRKASFEIGAKLASPDQVAAPPQAAQRTIGLEFEVTPAIVDDDQIWLDFMIYWSQFDPTRQAKVKDVMVPGVRAHEISSGGQADVGRTMVMHGGTQQREITRVLADGRKVSELEEIQILYLLTPTLVDAMAADTMPTATTAIAEVATAASSPVAQPAPSKEMDTRRTDVSPQRFKVKLQVAEISLTRMRALGIDFMSVRDAAAIKNSADNNILVAAHDRIDFDIFRRSDSQGFKMFLAALEKEGVYRVVCDQSVIGSGGIKSYSMAEAKLAPDAAEAVPSGTANRTIGWELEVTPKLIGVDQIWLDFMVHWSQLSPSVTTTVNNFAAPVVRAQKIRSAYQTAPGETIVVASGVQQRQFSRRLPDGKEIADSEEIQIFFLLTPTPLEATSNSAATSPPTATKSSVEKAVR